MVPVTSAPVATVTITDPCPTCGQTTVWRGRIADNGGGTTYDITCRCIFQLKDGQSYSLPRHLKPPGSRR